MGLNIFRGVFIGVTLLICILAVLPLIPALQSDSTSYYPAYWLTGSDGEIKSLPFDVSADVSYSLILMTEHKADQLIRHQMRLKWCNLTEAPMVNATSQVLPTLLTLNYFVYPDEQYALPIDFSLTVDPETHPNICLVKDINVNGYELPVESVIARTPGNKDFFFQMLFEFWSQDSASNALKYDGYLSLWLNVTRT